MRFLIRSSQGNQQDQNLKNLPLKIQLFYPKDIISELAISGEKEYNSCNFPFQILIPDNIFDITKNYNDKKLQDFPDGRMKDFYQNKLETGKLKVTEKEYYWIEVKFEIPKGKNLKDKKEIFIKG